jgi:hypothetical protein
MLTTVPAIADREESRPRVRPLTAFAEEREPGGIFTEPVDVSVLHDLQVDEYGRRSRWVPADCLL